MAKLNGKVAVVTGASKGIGAAIAEKLGSEGANVVVNYAHDKAGAEKVTEKIMQSGGNAISVQAQAVNSSVYSATKRSGRCDFARAGLGTCTAENPCQFAFARRNRDRGCACAARVQERF